MSRYNQNYIRSYWLEKLTESQVLETYGIRNRAETKSFYDKGVAILAKSKHDFYNGKSALMNHEIDAKLESLAEKCHS